MEGSGQMLQRAVNGDSEMTAEAMQGYASLMDYNWDDGVEPELCLLLSYDYYWSGSFENSLKWIQRANWLRKQILPPEPAYLHWEVCVLKKLQRFNEARSALDRLSSAPVPPVEVEKRADEVRRWKQDCDKQIMHKNSKSDADDEESRGLQYALEYSLRLETTTQHGIFEAPVKQVIDEKLTPDSTSVRSWLSVSEHLKCFDSQVSKLPEGPRAAIMASPVIRCSQSEEIWMDHFPTKLLQRDFANHKGVH